MSLRSVRKAVKPMAYEDPMVERFERRLGEECGKLRLELAGLRTEVADGSTRLQTDILGLRAEMIDRNTDLLKWFLGFFVAQTAALAALMALFR
jgi:hypothetical protein